MIISVSRLSPMSSRHQCAESGTEAASEKMTCVGEGDRCKHNIQHPN